MRTDTLYDIPEVVLAYIDAQRPPYPHEDFRTFRRARVAALESAYNIRMSGAGHTGSGALLMLFNTTVRSFLELRGPRAGFLEDGLITVTVERLDTPELKLAQTEARIHDLLAQARAAHLELLNSLFICLWGPIEHPLTSAALRDRGFDDAAEPKLSDYYDEM